MESAPELQSMIKQRRISPLIAAWTLVFVIIASTYAWLSLTAEDMDNPQMASEEGASAQEQKPSDSADPQKTQTEPNIIVASGPEEEEHEAAPQTSHENTPAADQSGEDMAKAETSPQKNIQAEAPDVMSPGKSTRGDVLSASSSSQPLPKAPISGLSIKGANGLLPVLGPDGLQAWKEYARPFDDSDNRPRIALIVTGIGLNSSNSRRAIEELPPEVDLAFSPYGRDLQNWMDQARDRGHEALLMVPAEPMNYPDNDPGPHSLMTETSVRDNLKRLDWIMSQVSGYIGLINHMGSKFTASEIAVTPVLEDVKSRGLMFVDARASRFSMAARVARRLSVPRAVNNRYIDNKVNRSAIAGHLRGLENTARTYGAALGVARAYPLSINEINAWAKTLEERGFVLAPVSAIANRQPVK